MQMKSVNVASSHAADAAPVAISNIEMRTVRLPLHEPFETSFGRIDSRLIFLVSVNGDGLSGWGEVVAAEEPRYSYETVKTAQHVIRDFLAPAMMSRPVIDLADLAERFNSFRGHNMAKAGLELAYMDLLAQIKGKSLSDLIGGTRAAVPVGVSLGIQPSLDQLLERVESYLAKGYQRIKLKIKPGWDVEVVREVRSRHPDILLSVDANSAYTLAAEDTMRALDDFGLLMIEQPLNQPGKRIVLANLNAIFHQDWLGPILGPDRELACERGQFSIGQILFRLQSDGGNLRIVNRAVTGRAFDFDTVGMEREPGARAPGLPRDGLQT